MSLNKVAIQSWKLQASGAGPGNTETSSAIANRNADPTLGGAGHHPVGAVAKAMHSGHMKAHSPHADSTELLPTVQGWL